MDRLITKEDETESKINDIVEWINKFELDLEKGKFKLTTDDKNYYALKRFKD